MNNDIKGQIEKDCTACNEYQKARVHAYCPAHRYCDCEVSQAEELERDVWVCMDCDREIDPSIAEYHLENMYDEWIESKLCDQLENELSIEQ